MTDADQCPACHPDTGEGALCATHRHAAARLLGEVSIRRQAQSLPPSRRGESTGCLFRTAAVGAAVFAATWGAGIRG